MGLVGQSIEQVWVDTEQPKAEAIIDVSRPGIGAALRPVNSIINPMVRGYSRLRRTEKLMRGEVERELGYFLSGLNEQPLLSGS